MYELFEAHLLVRLLREFAYQSGKTKPMTVEILFAFLGDNENRSCKTVNFVMAYFLLFTFLQYGELIDISHFLRRPNPTALLGNTPSEKRV